MERHERTQRTYALAATATLILTAGCGNSVSQLLDPASAMMLAGDAPFDGVATKSGDALLQSADHDPRLLQGKESQETRRRGTEATRASGPTAPPDRPITGRATQVEQTLPRPIRRVNALEKYLDPKEGLVGGRQAERPAASTLGPTKRTRTRKDSAPGS